MLLANENNEPNLFFFSYNSLNVVLLNNNILYVQLIELQFLFWPRYKINNIMTSAKTIIIVCKKWRLAF